MKRKDWIIDVLGALVIFIIFVNIIVWWKAALFALLAVPFCHCWVHVFIHWLAYTDCPEERLPHTLVGLFCGIIMFSLIAL